MLLPCMLCSQVVQRIHPSQKNTVEIKWYSPSLVNPGGYNVYRKTENSDWIKLTVHPVVPAVNNPTAFEFAADPLLHTYIELASQPSQIKDKILLALVLRSFA